MMPPAIKFYLGERISGTRLRYISEAPRFNPKRRRAKFHCDCGKIIESDLNWVRFLNVTSCGCYKSETVAASNAKHHNAIRSNMTGAYRSWQAMHRRVKVDPNYSNIEICDRWSGNDGFANFLADMGERPESFTIERKDNHKGYEPSNCVWASKLDQAQNTRQTVRVTILGETKSIREWCRKLKIRYEMVKARRRAGMPLDLAIITPVTVAKQRKKK